MTKNKNLELSRGCLRRPISRRKRFEALERSGFRCVYFGRGPQDGVVLQVDHALPVARIAEGNRLALLQGDTAVWGPSGLLS